MAIYKNTPPVVTSGLVLCLDAANRQSYVSGSTTWRDLSGNGNNGTLVNGTSFSTEIGGCMVFNGINNYVSFDNPLDQSQLSQVWTVQAWINITTKPQQLLIDGLAFGLYVEYT